MNPVLHVKCPSCGWIGTTKETVAPIERGNGPLCPECRCNVILTRIANQAMEVDGD